MRTMQEVIKYSLFLNERKAVKYYSFIACRKVLCVSCWNGSKTCVIEASQCKSILGEVVGDPLLVPTTVVGNAAMPVVVEQPTAAPLAANVGSPERVVEEERQRDAEEKKVAEEEKMSLAEEKQQKSEEAEEKKEEVEQKRQELEEGKEQVGDHQTELEKSEIFRGRYY